MGDNPVIWYAVINKFRQSGIIAPQDRAVEHEQNVDHLRLVELSDYEILRDKLQIAVNALEYYACKDLYCGSYSAGEYEHARIESEDGETAKAALNAMSKTIRAPNTLAKTVAASVTTLAIDASAADGSTKPSSQANKGK